jgi:hypothetical protein
MTFNAIFDESGTHPTSDLVVFAGLVCEQPKCDALSRAWNKRLHNSDLNISFLHMVDLNRRHQRSTDETEKRKLEILIEDLANILGEHVGEGCINSITTSEFNALSPELRKRHSRPFFYAFEAGVKAMISASIEPRDNLVLICDDSDDAGECLRAFRRLKKMEPAITEKLPFISFGDDRMYPPLQAADMFAYCHRAKRTASLEGLWTKASTILEGTFSDVSRKDIRLFEDEVQ